jgi:hypothetical protein
MLGLAPQGATGIVERERCGACLLVGWVVVQRSTSPDGKATVTVLKRCVGPDCLVRVQLETPSASKFIFDDRQDRLPTKSMVAWSPNSRVFAVLVCDTSGSPILLGFDTKEQHAIEMRAAIELLGVAMRPRRLNDTVMQPSFCVKSTSGE